MVFPVMIYCVAMSATPGPNNMMLTASGAKFGYRRTIPLIAGIVLGILTMLTLSALGLGAVFERYPMIQKILKIIGSVYLLYLAYRIVFSGNSGSREDDDDRPLRLWQGLLFQYANPKAYVIAVTAISVYTRPGNEFIRSALVILLVFALIVPFSISLWTLFGTVIGRVMLQSAYGRYINWVLGLLTAASVVFIWL